MFDMMLFIVAMCSMVAMVASAIPSFCLLRRGTGSQIAADWGLLLLGESEGMRRYEDDDVARGGREGENIIFMMMMIIIIIIIMLIFMLMMAFRRY